METSSKVPSYDNGCMNTAKIACAALALVLVAACAAAMYDRMEDGGQAVPPATSHSPTPIDVLKQTYMESSFATAYITPSNGAVMAYAEAFDSIEALYGAATGWLWVSDKVLYGVEDHWVMPEQFLDSGQLNTNPVPGTIVGDCEDQACGLVTLLRAHGMAPEDVRVGVGKVIIDDPETDNSLVALHCWVEYRSGQTWVALDPSLATFWDVQAGALVHHDAKPSGYYENVPYPVAELWAYFNDKYYFCALNGYGEAPAQWDIKGYS